jgi:predicted metal-dependent peptidase
MKVKKGDYTILRKNKGDEKGDGGGSGSGGSSQTGASTHGVGGIISAEKSIEKQQELGVPVETADKSDMDRIQQEAVKNMSKTNSSGSGKGLLKRAIERFSKPQVNWKNELSRIIGKIISKSEEYFGKRKHLYKDEYFYGDKDSSPILRNAVVLVDTSGSMGDEQLRMILGEVYSIIKTKKIRKTEVIYFDDGIQAVDVVKNPPVFDFSKVKGGGGTDFEAPMQEVEKREKQRKLELAVFCTDGLISNLPAFFKKYEKSSFRNKLVWLILDNPGWDAPFGKVIHISEKK